jgi:hypothetical protein
MPGWRRNARHGQAPTPAEISCMWLPMLRERAVGQPEADGSIPRP